MPVAEVEIINKLGLHARASAKLTQTATRSALGFDLTPPDVHVLKLIDEQRGLNLQDLGRQMCRDKALITRKIRELEGRNLVRRERNPSDQRSFQLFLTDEGLAIHQHAEAIMSRVHDELFAPLTPVEQATLVHLLDQCLAAQPLEDI